MNSLFNCRFKSLVKVMFLHIFFLLWASLVFATGNDSLSVRADSVKTLVVHHKDFKTNIQPDMLSENSASQIRAGLIYDCNTRTIVWEKDMKYAYPIASLTKMMVALLTIEDIKAGNVDWLDKIETERSYRASRRSRRVIKVKETYTLEGLLKMAMIPSNNEACALIGKYLGGSVDNICKENEYQSC